MKKKEELGRGIRALLQNMDSDMPGSDVGFKNSAEITSINEVPLEQIEINPFQPRMDFDEDALEELAHSIKIHGLIQPITLRKLTGSKYQLIAGERRLRAAKMAGLKQIAAYIRTANDQEMLEMALLENTQRENLNAVEVAITYRRLMEECNLTQESLSDRMGKDRTTITNYLRLLKLPPDIQAGIKEKKISMGHARALINIPEVDKQLHIYKEIINKDLSVRQVEELVRNLNKRPEPKQQKQKNLPLSYQKLQDELVSKFSTKVELKKNKDGKGHITIPFYNENDLNRVLNILNID